MNRQGENSTIPWADWSWNPISGCSPESEGCDHCYAAGISRRFKLPWGEPVFHPERLAQPADVKKPGRIFVCSMADIGHEGVAFVWREMIAAAMRDAPWHTYILLTKRPEMMADFELPAEICWLGVSIERQKYEYRWDVIRHRTDVAVRFISVEPMLEPVSIDKWEVNPDWVICGPETGAGARECNPHWIGLLDRECFDFGIPFFDKRKDFSSREWPAA